MIGWMYLIFTYRRFPVYALDFEVGNDMLRKFLAFPGGTPNTIGFVPVMMVLKLILNVLFKLPEEPKEEEDKDEKEKKED